MRKRIVQLFLGWLAVMPSSPAWGIVVELTANLESDARMIVGGQEVTSDSSIEQFGATAFDLPVSTRAMVDTDEAVSNDGVGLSVVEFFDPTQLTLTRNPEELALEANCFSNDPDARYEADSTLVEKRVVRLSVQELRGLAGRPQTVNSVFFPSGAIFAWSLNSGTNLSGLVGEVTFVVRRIGMSSDSAGDSSGADGDGTVELIRETVSLRGLADGSIVAENSDGLFVLSGGLDILPDVPGIPSGGGAVLAAAQLAVLPDGQQIPYSYEATANEEFVMEAEVQLRVRCVPDGTGVVAVFGRPFTEAASIIEAAIPDSGAKSLTPRMNAAIRQGNDSRGLFGSPLLHGCGAFGFEAAALGVLPLWLCGGVMGRRRRLGGTDRLR